MFSRDPAVAFYVPVPNGTASQKYLLHIIS